MAIVNFPHWILISIVQLLLLWEEPNIRWWFRLERKLGYNICYGGLGTTTVVRDYQGCDRFICCTHRAIDILRTLHCPLYRKCKQHQCYQRFLGLPYKFHFVLFYFIKMYTVFTVPKPLHESFKTLTLAMYNVNSLPVKWVIKKILKFLLDENKSNFWRWARFGIIVVSSVVVEWLFDLVNRF